MASLGELLVKVGANIEGFERSMGTVSQRLGAVVRDADKAGAGFVRLGDRLTKVGMGLTAALTAPLAGVGLVATKAFADFDAAMTQSLAIMGDVSAAMRGEMAAAARQMALESTFSAKQAADSYFYLASAGLDAKASIMALPVVTKFAQAGMFDMSLATDLLTDAQSALGLTIRDDAVANMNNMVKVSDVLVKANTLANASVQQFSEALTTKAGAALKALGKDIEEGVAVLAAFADQGVKAAEGGTQFSIVLRDLQTKAIENKEEFQHLGVAVFDSQGEMRNMADIIGDLEGALAGMSDEQKKAALLTMGFSDKSISAMLALIGTSDAIRGYEKALREAGGTTETVAKKQLETFSSQMTLLKHRLTDSAITIGQSLVPAMQGIIKVAEPVLGFIEGLVRKFGELPPSLQVAIMGFGGMLAALGPLAIVTGQVIKAFGLIHATVLNLGPAIIGLVGSAIGPLAAGIGSVVVTMGPLLPLLAGLGIAVGILVKSFLDMEPPTRAVGSALEKLDQQAKTSEKTIGDLENQLRNLGVTAQQLDKIYEESGGKVGEYRNFLDWLWNTIKGTDADTAKYTKSLRELKDELDPAPVTKLANAFETLGVKSTAKLKEELGKAQKALGEIREAMKRGEATQADYARAQEAVRKISERLAAQTGKTTISLKDQKKAQEEAQKAAKELAAALETLGLRTKADAQREQYIEAWRRVDEAFRKGQVSAAQYFQALDALQQKLGGWSSEVLNRALAETDQRLSGLSIKHAQWVIDLDRVGKQYLTLAAQQDQSWEALNRIANERSRTADMAIQYAAVLVPGAMEAQNSAILKASQEVEKHTSKWNDLGRQVSTIMTDMSKGITDVIWGSAEIGDVFKGTLEEMGKAVTRFVVEYLEGKLFKALGNLLDDILPSVGRAIGGLFGVGGGTAGAAGQAAGGAAGTAGGVAGGAGQAAATGVAGWVGAIGSAVSGITGVIGAFQAARQENTLNAIEESTRYSKSHLYYILDKVGQHLPKLDSIAEYLWGAQLNMLCQIHDTLAYDLRDRMIDVRDALLAPAQPQIINISVSVASGDPTAIANRIAATLRTQGALA